MFIAHEEPVTAGLLRALEPGELTEARLVTTEKTPLDRAAGGAAAAADG
jgi:hypothetical protein